MNCMIKTILSVIALAFLSACSNAKFAVVNAPALTYDGQIISDVAYGEDERQKLDIYIPEQFEKPMPVIVFFHGGRWTFGSKDQYKFVGLTLSKMGYMVVMPNTRLYPTVKHPVFVEDGAQAVSWVYNNIADYGGDNNLFLSGHSSGAHIAALITADQNYLKKYNLSPDVIKGFAGISGPYDFDPDTDDLRDMFGPPSNYPTMQVTTYIDGNEPPMLLIYTADDETVHVRNLNRLKSKIEGEGGNVQSIIYAKGNHVDAVAGLSWVNMAGIPIADDMDGFFRKNLN